MAASMKLISTFRNLKLRANILGLVGILLAVIGVNGAITLWKLELIGTEMSDVAEVDSSLTRKVTEVAIAQLEQGSDFERTIRIAEILAKGLDSREHYEQTRRHFEEFGHKAEEALSGAEALAAEAMTEAHGTAQQHELESVQQ